MNKQEEHREIDLMQYWRIIVKRKWIAITFGLAVIVFTAIFTFTARPVYQATATLMIDESSTRTLSFEDEFGFRRNVSDMRFFNTQLRLLRSRSLAERVAKKLNMRPQRPEPNASKSLTAKLKDVLTLQWLLGRGGEGDRDQAVASRLNPYYGIVSMIVSSLQVRPIPNTKLVELSYSQGSPLAAANLVNTLADEFKDFSIEKRYEATQQASNFLSEQIANLREEIASTQGELQRYSKDKDILILSESENASVSKLNELYGAYTQVTIDRIAAYNTYTTLRGLAIDSIPHVIDSPVIQDLYSRFTESRRQYQENQGRFGPDYPRMRQLRSRMESLETELRSEISKAVDAAQQEYQQARSHEYSLKQQLDLQKQAVAQSDSDGIQFNYLRIDLDSKTKQLNSLVQMQEETRVSSQLQGYKSSNISVIDAADVPRSPVSPNRRKNLMMALIFGLFGGVGLCFLLEYLDNTVKAPEDVEKLSGLPSLGMIPYLPPEGEDQRKRIKYFSKYNDFYSYSDEQGERLSADEVKEIELVNHLFPNFFISEDYRTVRTSILLSHVGHPPKTIAVTSALPRDGKSTTVTNLAVSFSQLSQKVLLIDSDMRKPRLHRIFDMKNTIGLSSCLTGKNSLKDAIKMTVIDNIWVLPCGPTPPNPAELLNSEKIRELLREAEEEFDIILIDTPPVMAAIDTVILSTMVEAVLVVVRSGKTNNKAFSLAIESLRKANANIIGTVLNEVFVEQVGYAYADYHYYHSHSSD